MTVYDMKVPIHETTDDLPSMHGLIEQLDYMLNQYSVKHCFAFATGDEQERVEEESGKELLYWLYYDAEQNTELTLIIGLFLKMHIKKDDADILASIVKSMTRAA